ncbi:MAG: hypothetical protein PHU42_03730 [Patescibacteria group bacterium]|nr:hypothetical protein [Patescibacteria group bacterium]
MKKIKNILKFEYLAVAVFIIGLGAWGVTAYNFYKIKKTEQVVESKLLPVGGSSDTMMRTQAINEAIKQGKNTYSFETNQGPPMMGDPKSQAPNDK